MELRTLAIVVSAMLIPATPLARGQLTDSRGMAEQEPRYDSATVIDFESTVTEVREVPRMSPLNGLHVTMTFKSETIDVYLGPVDYLKDFEITFHKGDRLHVAGSKVKSGDTLVVLAREVRRGGTTVYLRDRKGEPHWTAQGRPRT